MSLISTPQVTDEVLQELARAIAQLHYGSIEITVHEGRVTQIERREKTRFNQSPAQASHKITPDSQDKPTVSAAAQY